MFPRSMIALVGLVSFFTLLFPSGARAAVLLAEKNAGGCCGFWSGGSSAPVADIIGMSFTIGYGKPLQDPLNLSLNSTLVGGDRSFVPGDNGVFDFNASNSAAFTSVAARLSDGVVDTSLFTIAIFGFNSSGNLKGGTSGTSCEANSWIGGGCSQSPGDPSNFLVGDEISHFRLIVNSVEWGVLPDGRFGIFSDATWQIYGTQAPSPVPLPAALPLFLSALAGLGLVGWRRRQAGA